MSFFEDICNWCARVLQCLQEFWSMMVNMLLHDFRFNWGDSPMVIRLEDVESRQLDNDFEVVEEAFPMVHYTVEHRKFKRQSFNTSSPKFEEHPVRTAVPAMSRLQYLRSYNNIDDDDPIPMVELLKPRPHTNFEVDANNLNLPSTSKM